MPLKVKLFDINALHRNEITGEIEDNYQEKKHVESPQKDNSSSRKQSLSAHAENVSARSFSSSKKYKSCFGLKANNDICQKPIDEYIIKSIDP